MELVLKGLDTPNDAALCFFLSVNVKTSKKSMADRAVSPRWAMIFSETVAFLSVNGKLERKAWGIMSFSQRVVGKR